jgi:hypothetical protein
VQIDVLNVLPDSAIELSGEKEGGGFVIHRDPAVFIHRNKAAGHGGYGDIGPPFISLEGFDPVFELLDSRSVCARAGYPP